MSGHESMDDAPKQTPLKSCPICHVAMQAAATDTGIIHRCEQCGVTFRVGKQKSNDK